MSDTVSWRVVLMSMLPLARSVTSAPMMRKHALNAAVRAPMGIPHGAGAHLTFQPLPAVARTS